ncbi:hypothetical protein RDABS01_027633 [Bienertia sinuspersici]
MTKSEVSDSNSSNSSPQKPNIVTRPNKQNGGCSRFKGVVYQQNGNWGAQIYANHQRIWLGTFRTEAAAAAAYDSAAIKLRHGNPGQAYRNFPCTTLTMHEPNFQAHYTNDQVLNMIKDGSYPTKFGEYLSSISQLSNPLTSNLNTNNQNNENGYFCQELFRKELTPSDVGKLNRLVIPKRYALKYFPVNDYIRNNLGVSEGENQGGEDQGDEDMELVFYDKTMRSWNFRYCYWKSSQSFVFTRGWNKFVKVKEVEAKDIVVFYMCEYKEKIAENLEKFWMIDIVKNNDNVHGNKIEQAVKTKKNGKGFRLFGVQVVPVNCDEEL